MLQLAAFLMLLSCCLRGVWHVTRNTLHMFVNNIILLCSTCYKYLLSSMSESSLYLSQSTCIKLIIRLMLFMLGSCHLYIVFCCCNVHYSGINTYPLPLRHADGRTSILFSWALRESNVYKKCIKNRFNVSFSALMSYMQISSKEIKKIACVFFVFFFYF